MLYDIRHLTAYDYASTVSSARCVLRLKPRDAAGQRCRAHGVAVKPQPRRRQPGVDFFGNAVESILIDAPHGALSIEARSIVEVSRPARPSSAGESVERVAAAALRERALAPDSPAHYLYASPLVAPVEAVTAYARNSLPTSRDALEGARELMARIRADFDYEPEATDVATPLTEAFAARRGVCQDFAHIMIAGLRGVGVPARYVSGYIRTIPPPGEKRLDGADATHAWVDVWCGETAGWRGLDPTNAIEAGADHIELAVGRDFSDVSPVYGVILGAGEQKLEVAVDVVPIEG
ncbi:MAG: transglutaminase family protein [Rhizobiales bacterium]|nr:transglutaminase family protein [Hyphomicrobiales bacterium]